MNKIDICKKTRSFASQALASCLRSLLFTGQKLSEKQFADTWLEELRKNTAIFPDGWYTPPPHGICVLFGSTERDSRHNYQTLRSEDMWPKGDVYLNRQNGISYLFASPVDRKSGIIGDFGLTVYFGNDSIVKQHLITCLSINRLIFEYIDIGKKFSEVYSYAEKIISEHGLKNGVVSTTDPAGKNFGHTVPAIYFEWTSREQSILDNAESDWDTFKNMINKKRVFVNPIEETTYKPGMAITLEPRLIVPDNPHIPMGSFHTIVTIHKDGKKELLTNFDEVFRTAGMDFMLNL